MAPLSDEVLSKLTDLFKDYVNEFEVAFSICLSIAGNVPNPQVNNEIKNFTTHLSRVYLEGKEEDLKKASDHLKRAKRDCYKIIVETVLTLYRTLLSYEHASERIPREEYHRLTNGFVYLQSKGVEIRNNETKGVSGVTEEYAIYAIEAIKNWDELREIVQKYQDISNS